MVITFFVTFVQVTNWSCFAENYKTTKLGQDKDHSWFRWLTQSSFTCSKPTIETPEQCVKSIQS